MDDGSLRREAIRVYRRYQTEIVEGLKLCPWAERARLEGQVREEVLLGDAADAAPVLDVIEALAKDRSVEIGILIFPRFEASFSEFERFVSEVVAKDAERRELGTTPFALAAFHPDARPDLGDAERVIPFLRRTPDPTIQLVRYEALENVREGFNEGTRFIDVKALMTLDWTRDDTLPLRERIARANLRTVERLGIAALERRFAEIRKDRDAAYGR